MNRLKIAFVVGTLGLGGAEKQLVYMVKSLQQSGAHIRIYCLTTDEYFETALKEIGLSPVWIGKIQNPLWRLLKLAIELRNFRPHIIQSAHFYTNLYVALVAMIYKSVGIGSIRSDTYNDVDGNGFWGMELLKAPQTLISNSNMAKCNAVSLGVQEDRIFVLPNAIDLAFFDRDYSDFSLSLPFKKNEAQINAVVIGNLFPEKRLDRFLRALHKARDSVPTLRGFVVGDGQERDPLEKLAANLGLFPDGVRFVGWNDNIPALLSQAEFLVLSSANEGMPNVILEAMAARLPVITTPVGDASVAVVHGVTGYVVPFDDINTLVDCLVNLSTSPELRQKFGEAGRNRVEQYYSYGLLGDRLLRIYAEIGSKLGDSRLQKAL